MSKIIVSGKELKRKMIKSVNMICDAVKSTLGPSGNNVIINESDLMPYITNDGVTIAQSFESNDLIENTILFITKEASIKTNENVGDGTTTTLVLLQSIFNEGMKLIKKGHNPIKIKQEIDKSLDIVIEELNKLKRKCNDDDLKSIASVSSNDKEIGEYISNIYKKTSLLQIKEGVGNETTYEIVNGYSFESCLSSSLFLNNKKEINLFDCYVLLSFDRIESIYELNSIVSEIENDKSFLIVAEDFSENVINHFLTENYQNNLNTALVKVSQYGKNKIDVFKDLQVITKFNLYNASYGKKVSDIKIEDLGFAKEIKINIEETIVINPKDEEINSYRCELKKELSTSSSEFEKAWVQSRIAKFENGVGIIYVGAYTDIERKEKKMRFDDALCALNSCKEGVLIGGGLSLLEIQDKAKISSMIKKSLDKPFLQILDNMCLNKEKILKKIKNSGFRLIYNVIGMHYEDVRKTKIIDPYLVVKNEIINACSIAGMLLTTKYLIVNEKDNSSNYLEKDIINPY